jgi:hypothetical protein
MTILARNRIDLHLTPWAATQCAPAPPPGTHTFYDCCDFSVGFIQTCIIRFESVHVSFSSAWNNDGGTQEGEIQEAMGWPRTGHPELNVVGARRIEERGG